MMAKLYDYTWVKKTKQYTRKTDNILEKQVYMSLIHFSMFWNYISLLDRDGFLTMEI